MKRKRGELVSVTEALADLPDPVKLVRGASPQALHHFTQADQVNQLVSASEADANLGFMARLMALCSLPRSNPGNRKEYKRVNGPFTLYMNAIAGSKLPFGSGPRLVLAWLCTEVVRTQSRDIVLGRSFSEFMRTLGITSINGPAQTRLRNQMKRLFSCSVSMVYTEAARQASAYAVIADTTDFWWNAKQPDQAGLWESKVRLSESFFNEIIRHPVPLDMNTLTALKRSSLGLDLYLWLTYRLFSLRAPKRLTWRSLYRQFGVDPDKASDRVTVRNFQRKALREFKKIKIAWPSLNYTTAPGVLILYPSTPVIAPSDHHQLAN